MNSENSMRPSCRQTKSEGWWASYTRCSLLRRYNVLDAFGWKWGQTSCSELLAIFALHLVLSWGRNMSPVVISETDALRLYRTSKYQTNIPKLLWSQSISPIFTIILSHLMNGDRWKSPTLTSELWPFLPFQALDLAGICLKIPNSLSAVDFQWTQWGEIPASMDSYWFCTAPNALTAQEHISCWKTHG